jgi:hypothetical protein
LTSPPKPHAFVSLPIQSSININKVKYLNIRYILLKCNDFTKELSVIFEVLQYILNIMKLLSTNKVNSFIFIPLFGVCVHGVAGACTLCAQAAAEAAEIAKQTANIGACTHS